MTAKRVSDWGAQDMIGNAAEWTDEWHATANTELSSVVSSWPVGPSYGDDTLGDIVSSAWTHETGGYVSGVPSAASRGGQSNEGTGAGIFNVGLGTPPSGWGGWLGFRCVVPR